MNYTDADQGDGLAVIGVSDFKDNVVADLSKLAQVNLSALGKVDALIRKRDIIFVRSNGNRELIGRSMFVSDAPVMPTSHSGFTIRCRFHDPRCHPRFYAYLLRGPIVRQRLSALGGGTNISNLNQGILSSLLVPIPDFGTQERIASILSAYDDLIENNTRRIAILEETARAIYEEWFVHFRPGGELLPLVDSPLS
ncbi:restriction endonuclease subunit S [Mesorhizobium sp. M0622]|uniref:restriction endonuclease subunit S n=1 Tax=Mesorhizobium sp. M0622 TaxID=2956975 RepID=UPI003335BB2D